ncbi:MAG: 4Fe-4S dicluster domain-containing protein [Polyangia bacterium]
MAAPGTEQAAAPARILDATELQALFLVLQRRGLRVLGPAVRDGVLVLTELRSASELSRGTHDVQAPGRYRLMPAADAAYFGVTLGPQGLKPQLFAPRQRLVQLRRKADRVQATAEPLPAERVALLGARACDLAAVAVQDRVFLGGPQREPYYQAARAQALLIAVECTRAAATCFCASVGTGPAVCSPHDLRLTEVIEEAGGAAGVEDGEDAADAEGPSARAGGAHYFVCRAGSAEGAEILAELPTRAAAPHELERAAAAVQRAADMQVRTLPQDGLREALNRAVAASPPHPRWDEVAERCLGCGSCTLVCPTCFCSTLEDQASLDGTAAERWRRWDSCFSSDHSALHGRPVRTDIKARYRQWLTHKLANWIDQFGTSGCVGCGRCITWCPVGIDLTEEAAALRTVPPPRKVQQEEATP